MRQQFVRRLSTAATVALASFSATAGSVFAQRLGPPPPRPKLVAEADTNDAETYHDFAMDNFDKDPKAAAAGFYWAARIQPDYASALYGRRASVIAGNPDLLGMFAKMSPNSKEVLEFRATDSLYVRALQINPFLFTRLDKRLLEISLRQVMTPKSISARNSMDRVGLDIMIANFIYASGPQMQAWAAYNNGAFQQALKLYATALKDPKAKPAMKAGMHTERARTFGILGDADSAVTEFNLALEEMRKKDTQDIVRLYNSKAMLEQSVGRIYQQADFIDEARAAYGRAIQEDLSFYPAHIQLASIAAAEHDTAAALSEMSLAAQIAKDEPHVHFNYGDLLAHFGKSSEAVAELKIAIKKEPYYARPYPRLVNLLQKSGDKVAALAACERFLQIASQRDVDRVRMIEKRIELRKEIAAK